MSLSSLIGALALGGLAGVLSGLVGIGGGIVMVPALALFFGLSQHQAQGTTLGALILPVGALAVWEYHKRHQVLWPVSAGIALGFFAGGLIGGRLAGWIPENWLAKGFGALLVFSGIRLLLSGFKNS